MIEKFPHEPARRIDIKDHLANERTFLAWIRTNLGIMAFGFVIVKFSFFIEQIASFVGRTALPEPSSTNANLIGYSSAVGMALVGLGTLLCILAFLKFIKTQKQIDIAAYRSSTWLYTLLAIGIFFIGVILIDCLLVSRPTMPV